MVLVADLVSVDGRAGATGNRANHSALLPTDQAAEKCSTYCAPRSSDLVSVLIPNGTVRAVAIVVIAVDVVVIRVGPIGIITIDVAAILAIAVGARIVSAIVATVVSRPICAASPRLRRNWQGSHAKNDQGNKGCD